MRLEWRKWIVFFLLVLAVSAVLAACNKPVQNMDGSGGQEQESAPPPVQDEQAFEEELLEESPAEESEPDLYDAAYLIDHVTILTGTVLGRGQVFTKTWALENTGTTIWTNEYGLIFDQGEQMSGPGDQPLLHYYQPLIETVQPGELISVTVVLTTPLEEGQYVGYWLLRNIEAQTFGIGEEFQDPLNVDILVKAGAGTEVNQIERTSLSVTPSDYSGPCPVQLIFSGSVEVQGMGPFEYEYVHNVNTALPGWEYLIPPPNQFSYDSPGWYVVDTSFLIDIPEDTDGFMRLESIGPGSSSFSEVYYNVDCK